MNIRATGTNHEQIHFDKKPTQPKETDQQQIAKDQVEVNGKAEQGVHKKWTFLHYGAADNDLSSYIKKDVIEMQKVGSDNNTHLISQLDQFKQDCKSYYLVKDKTAKQITSPTLQNLGKIDTSHPDTLKNFLIWGMKNFPSDNVAVIISSHGYGTAGAGVDDSQGHMMSPKGMREAFEQAQEVTGKKVDIIGFDACLMANTEVAYELKDVANYMVASQESEGAEGWPYISVLTDRAIEGLQKALSSKINIPPEAFAKRIVTDSQDKKWLPTMSAVDLSKMDEVAKSFTGLSKALLETDTSGEFLQSLAQRTQKFEIFRDSYDFCDKIVRSRVIKDPKLKEEAANTMKALKEAVIANKDSDSHPNAHGLQMEVDKTVTYYDNSFTQDTGWGKAMMHMRNIESFPDKPQA